jgi:hypothetical protein
MAQPSYPMRFVLVALAGWINQPQRAVMDYLHGENCALRAQVGPGRLRFRDDQRRRLASKHKTLAARPAGHATIIGGGSRTRTGNGTNSARSVEKLRSGGNRRVEKCSPAKGWKQT